jgi:hypothetical protein
MNARWESELKRQHRGRQEAAEAAHHCKGHPDLHFPAMNSFSEKNNDKTMARCKVFRLFIL